MQSVVQAAIDALDTEDVVANLRKAFIPMAITHSKRNTSKESFFQLRTIIMEVLTEACNLNEEQQEAWMRFFNCGIHIIFSKFDQLAPKAKH